MDGRLYQRVAVFWVFVKTLFPIAPIISLARTLLAIAALCRDARPCVSTVPEKSYGTSRRRNALRLYLRRKYASILSGNNKYILYLSQAMGKEVQCPLSVSIKE